MVGEEGEETVVLHYYSEPYAGLMFQFYKTNWMQYLHLADRETRIVVNANIV